MSRKRKKSHWPAKIAVILLVLVVVAGSVNYLRPLPAVNAETKDLDIPAGNVKLSWPDDGSSAAVGAIGYGILSTDGNGQYPTASVAKLITALSVLSKYPLQANQSGPTITLSQSDVDIYNNYAAESGSIVQVESGEQLTEYQALQAMLLPSANNIADSLAIWAFGSLANYKTYATTYISELGLNATVIGDDASGFLPTTISTPNDLVKLGIDSLNNPIIAQIVAQTSAELPVVGTVYNVNTLLGQSGINGVKTGNSDQAGGCFLFSAPETLAGKTVTIVGAVMHAPDLNSALDDAQPLLNSTSNNFNPATPVTNDQTVGTYNTKWGASSDIIASKTLSIPVWSGYGVKSNINLKKVSGSLPAGSAVGTVTFSSGSYSIIEPLVIKQKLSPPSFLWRLKRI